MEEAVKRCHVMGSIFGIMIKQVQRPQVSSENRRPVTSLSLTTLSLMPLHQLTYMALKEFPCNEMTEEERDQT